MKATSATPGRLAERLVQGSCVDDDLVVDSNDLWIEEVVNSIGAYLCYHHARSKVSGPDPEQRKILQVTGVFSVRTARTHRGHSLVHDGLTCR